MVEIKTLSNGVRIVSEHMSAVRSAAVGIWVGVGSRNEKRGEEGSAHFIEHMLFKGTPSSTAAQLAGRMDSIGGQVNAFTARDSTCFYARVLDTHLNEASAILTEMFFDSLFAEEDVINERRVVLDEIDMYRDTPEDQVVEQLFPKVFPGSLGRPVLGKPSSLGKMTGGFLRVFKDREYTPERIVVAVCGSFTEENIQFLAERFSTLSPSRPAGYRRTAYTPYRMARHKATEQNQFCITWPGLPETSEERFTWQVLSTILGGGMSSRLFQKVREENGLCYAISSFTAAYRDTGLFGITAAMGRESEDRTLALIRSEVERFVADGITGEELLRARELMKSNVVLAMESTSSRMNRLGSSILLLGDCLSADEVIERYNAVTAEDVLSLARRIFLPEDLGFSALGRVSDVDHYMEILSY